MEKKKLGTVDIYEDGCVVRLVGHVPFALSTLESIDLQEQVQARRRVVTRRLDYKRWHRERAVASAFEASYTIQE